MSRMRSVNFFLVAAAILQGCLEGTAPRAAVTPLEGSWRYTGIQTSPTRESLAGAFVVSRQSGTSFQGTIDIVATNLDTGESRRLTGSLAGSTTPDGAIDMDAALGVPARRHIGLLSADIIVGTWLATGQGGASSSGTFRAERLGD